MKTKHVGIIRIWLTLIIYGALIGAIYGGIIGLIFSLAGMGEDVIMIWATDGFIQGLLVFISVPLGLGRLAKHFEVDIPLSFKLRIAFIIGITTIVTSLIPVTESLSIITVVSLLMNLSVMILSVILIRNFIINSVT